MGVYIGSLCADTNRSASMAIRAIFLMIAVLVHGYIRSVTPRLFIMVLLMAVPAIVGLVSVNRHIHMRECEYG